MNNVFVRALELIVTGNREVLFIASTSLRFALTSTVFATLFALPMGLFLTRSSFRGRKLIIIFLNSLMALPTVVIGLLVYSLISKNAPLGSLGLLFTPGAIIAGQVILAFPIIASLIYSALSNQDPTLPETLDTLGINGLRKYFTIVLESRTAVLSALLSGFGRVVGEVGVSMMLGGNIRWYTRTITTTIALETSKGNFELALALGILLIIISLSINFLLHMGFRDG